MNDTKYFAERAQQELRAAIKATDGRVRHIHLELADAYSFRLREMRAEERRAAMHLIKGSLAVA